MTAQKIINRFAAFVLLLLVCLCAVMGGQGNLSAFADDDTIQFEQTNVMDDLENSTVDGKAFNISDYAFNNSEEASVLMLVEYCYSFYANLQDNFGLYLYVWNPQGLKYVMEEDIVCPFGVEDKKLLLYDDFGCWDEGEYKGKVSKEVIANMPKSN